MTDGDPDPIPGPAARADAERCFEAGNAALRASDPFRAAEAYERAVALSPSHADAWLNLGATYRRLERTQDAAACARQVLQLRPDDPRALNNLANSLSAQGDFEEAARCYGRVLDIRPDDAEAWYNLVNLHPLNDGSAESKATFERLMRQAETVDRLDARAQSTLLFALGTALDARGEADLAFAALAKANALHRSTLGFDISASERFGAAIAERFDAALFARLAGAGSSSERPIFVIGMPRSGTTLVEQILSAHPQVHGAGEIGLLPTLVSRMRSPQGLGFPYLASELSADELQRLAAAYLGALEPLGGGKAKVTDKTIGNFELVGLIHLAFPNARIIHCRRDPRDVCVSCFSTRFSGGHDYAYDLVELGRYWRRYDRLMDHWRAVLRPGRMFEVDYETLTEDLDGSARRLIAHLALDWDDACLRFYELTREVRTASFAQVRRPIHNRSIGRWRRFAAQLAPLIETLDAS